MSISITASLTHYYPTQPGILILHMNYYNEEYCDVSIFMILMSPKGFTLFLTQLS